MKFATRKNGKRDGQPLLVSRDLSRAVDISTITPSLREALENWPQLEPALQRLYAQLNAGQAAGAFDFATAELESPLPRTF